MNPRDFEVTQRAAPPPAGPPQRIAPDMLAALVVFGGAAVAAVALLVPDTWGAYYATRLWLPLWVIACLVAGGALLEQRSKWVTRISRVSRHRLVDWGGGAYAAIALVCFGWLEWARFLEFWHSLQALAGTWGVRDFVRGLFDFGIDSFLNGVYAFVWPAFWKNAFSAGQMWPAALVGWGVFESGRWAVRQLATTAKPPSPPTRP
jgi:hypothetical protein